MWRCDSFKKASLSDRYDTLRRNGACFNCSQKGHRTTDCSSKHSCKKCSKRHHSTLHPTDHQQKKSEESIAAPPQPRPEREIGISIPDNPQGELGSVEAHSTFCAHPKETGKQVLLSTAVILVYGKGDLYPCRVLLDSGSHSNFISEHFATLLNLSKEPANGSITGLNDIHTKVRLKIHAKIKSRVTEYATCLEFFIVPRITGQLPLTKVDCSSLSFP